MSISMVDDEQGIVHLPTRSMENATSCSAEKLHNLMEVSSSGTKSVTHASYYRLCNDLPCMYKVNIYCRQCFELSIIMGVG